MSDEGTNKQVVLGAIQALNDRDLDRFFSLHTADTVSRESAVEEALVGEEFRSFLEEVFVAYPDMRVENERLIAEDDTVVAVNTASATFDGPFRDIQPTARRYVVKECVVFELDDGLIKSATIFQNQKSVEAQLGLS